MGPAPLACSVLPGLQADLPADVGRRDAGAVSGPSQARPSVTEQARSIRSRVAELCQRAEGTRQRTEALVEEAAALMLVAEQLLGPVPRKELLYRSEHARLRARLQTMPVIEQAKGIVMAQSGCGPEAAFDLLRRASQRSNVPVRELAAQIVAKAAQEPRADSQPGRRAS